MFFGILIILVFDLVFCLLRTGFARFCCFREFPILGGLCWFAVSEWHFALFGVGIRQISFGICQFADFPDLGGFLWILLTLIFWVYFTCLGLALFGFGVLRFALWVGVDL